MNEQQLRNQFRHDLSTLIEDVRRILEHPEINPYSKDSANTLHEHNTRIFFFDRLLTILGWRLGTGDNVTEEARIKAETTRFMDYVGLNQDTKAPLVIFEAKAWDVPFVSARKLEERIKDEELIAASIRHILNNRSEEESPVSKQWHGYLKQVLDYVHIMKMKKFGGMGVTELRRLRQLEEDNHRLKRLVADLSLDKEMLQDVIRKKF